MELLFGFIGIVIVIAVLVSIWRGRNASDCLDPYGMEEYEDDDYCDDDYCDCDGEVCETPGRPIIPVAPTDTLASLAAKIGRINRSNGWRTMDGYSPEEVWSVNPYYVPAILALVHSEISEALEDFRHDRREHFGEEVADTIIRLLDLCDILDIDIDHEVLVKMEKNSQRGYRHGGKRV